MSFLSITSFKSHYEASESFLRLLYFQLNDFYRNPSSIQWTYLQLLKIFFIDNIWNTYSILFSVLQLSNKLKDMTN